MKKILTLMILLATMSCKDKTAALTQKAESIFCSAQCEAKSKGAGAAVVCKLTTPEFQTRRATVLANLKKQVVEKKELNNGYAFKFAGSDDMVDELANFIKTERSCCAFFTFNLSVSGDKSEAWLELIGPDGSKEMINSEMNLLN